MKDLKEQVKSHLFFFLWSLYIYLNPYFPPQIANLKAALAKKEGDQEQKVSGSPGGKQLSSRSPPYLNGDPYTEPKPRRKPQTDVVVPNFEVINEL